jgi:hypothetical protein
MILFPWNVELEALPEEFANQNCVPTEPAISAEIIESYVPAQWTLDSRISLASGS